MRKQSKIGNKGSMWVAGFLVDESDENVNQAQVVSMARLKRREKNDIIGQKRYLSDKRESRHVEPTNSPPKRILLRVRKRLLNQLEKPIEVHNTPSKGEIMFQLFIKRTGANEYLALVRFVSMRWKNQGGNLIFQSINVITKSVNLFLPINGHDFRNS